MLLVQSAHCLGEIHTMLLIILRHFANQHRRINSVFVANMSTVQIPVALLEAEHEAISLVCLLKLSDEFTNVLEAR